MEGLLLSLVIHISRAWSDVDTQALKNPFIHFKTRPEYQLIRIPLADKTLKKYANNDERVCTRLPRHQTPKRHVSYSVLVFK